MMFILFILCIPQNFHCVLDNEYPSAVCNMNPIHEIELDLQQSV